MMNLRIFNKLKINMSKFKIFQRNELKSLITKLYLRERFKIIKFKLGDKRESKTKKQG